MAITDPLLIYPLDPNPNSFVGVGGADYILDYNINADIWMALTQEDKKRLLVKAFKDITNLEGFAFPPPPYPNLDCLQITQANLALQYIINDQIYNERRIKQEKVGPLSTTYQDQTLLEPDKFNTEAIACLKLHGVFQPNDAVAVGTIQKTRYGGI